jgi:hypothetical protein
MLKNKERWPSGLRQRLAKPSYFKKVSRVQIPFFLKSIMDIFKADITQLVEYRIVVSVVMGSNPIIRQQNKI